MGLNLHQIVRPLISAVNTDVKGTVQIYIGQDSKPGGIRVPKYRTCENVSMQVQPLTYDDIKLLDSLNIQGVRRKIYLNGHLDGLVRSQDKGGDIITLTTGPNAGVYLVALVSEAWPDWACVFCTLQNVV